MAIILPAFSGTTSKPLGTLDAGWIQRYLERL
jgi:hypothetical protein